MRLDSMKHPNTDVRASVLSAKLYGTYINENTLGAY
jgi:hypothetical protein